MKPRFLVIGVYSDGINPNHLLDEPFCDTLDFGEAVIARDAVRRAAIHFSRVEIIAVAQDEQVS